MADFLDHISLNGMSVNSMLYCLEYHGAKFYFMEPQWIKCYIQCLEKETEK